MTLTRVLFVEQTGSISGGQRVLTQILHSSSDITGLSCSVLVPAEGGNFNAFLRNSGISTVDLPTAKPLDQLTLLGILIWSWRAFWSLRQDVRRGRYSVIYANGQRVFLLSCLLGVYSSAKVYWHVHSALGHIGSMKNKFYRLLRRIFQPTVICVSKFIRDNIGGDAAVLYNGIDVDKFSPCQNAREKWRKEMGLNNDDFVVMMATQIAVGKKQDLALRAVKALIDQGVPIKLVILGDVVFPTNENVVFRGGILRLIDELNLTENVVVRPAVNNVSEYLNAADVALSCSDNEAFPLSILESMAVGLVTVAKNNGGPVEYIVSGENAYLYDTERQLTDILHQLYVSWESKDVAKIRQMARSTVVTGFDEGTFLRNWLHTVV